MEKECVYLAGNFSTSSKGGDANIMEVFENIRRGTNIAIHLLGTGKYAVYCPWLDFQLGLLSDLPKAAYQENSMEILERSDCVLVISGAGLNGGVDREIERAKELDIPVYYTLDSFMERERKSYP